MRLKDYVLAVITGFLTGLFLIPTLRILHAALPLGIPDIALLVIVPVLWAGGILLGQILGGIIPFMRQFAKYVAAGFLSASIDFGVLNILLAYFGVTAGAGYALSKGTSFIFGNINAYLWNRYWVFEGGSAQGMGQEYGRFLIVSIIGFLLNVGISSAIVNLISPQFGVSAAGWANLAAVLAAAIGILWNFVGYKLIVFKK